VSWLEETTTALLAAFPEGVAAMPTADEIPQFQVDRGHLRAVAEWLKANGANMCLDIGGVDYLTMARTPRFEVVYHFLHLPTDGSSNGFGKLRLRVPVPEEKPEVATVSDLWEAANPAEREIWDLYGIRFPGHPNLTRILMPDEWEGHPLRKDYPLQGPRANELTLEPADVNRFHPFKAP